jgi:hypothetical protein
MMTKDPMELAFEKSGGVAALVKWIKASSHNRGNFYSSFMSYIKRIQPLVQNNVNVKIEDVEGARRRLETAMMRIIEAKRAGTEDPAVFVNGMRLIEGMRQDASHIIVDGISYTRDGDPRPVTDDARRATVHDVETTIDPKPATADPRSQPPAVPPRTVVPGQTAGGALDGSADDNRSTTQKYLDWNGHWKLF